MQINIHVGDGNVKFDVNGDLNSDMLHGAFMSIINCMDSNLHDYFRHLAEKDDDVPEDVIELITDMSQATSMLLLSKYCRTLAEHVTNKLDEDTRDIVYETARDEYKRIQLMIAEEL